MNDVGRRAKNERLNHPTTIGLGDSMKIFIQKKQITKFTEIYKEIAIKINVNM